MQRKPPLHPSSHRRKISSPTQLWPASPKQETPASTQLWLTCPNWREDVHTTPVDLSAFPDMSIPKKIYGIQFYSQDYLSAFPDMSIPKGRSFISTAPVSYTQQPTSPVKPPVADSKSENPPVTILSSMAKR